MNARLLKNFFLGSAVALSAFALSACGHHVEGTYVDNDQKVTIELKKGGEAIITDHGKADKTTWEMNGKDKVVLKGKEFGNMVLDINSDGNLAAAGGVMGVYKKQ